MPRAQPFLRKDVDERGAIPSEWYAIKKISAHWNIEPSKQERFKRELSQFVRCYRLGMLADKQEHPARIKKSLEHLTRVRIDVESALRFLSEGLRFEVDPGNAQGNVPALLQKTRDRIAYWKGRHNSNRIGGAQRRTQQLALILHDLFRRFSARRFVGTSNQRERWERQYVAHALGKLEIRYSNEAKNRGQFYGPIRRKRSK